jgi:hypothetical protein
LLQIVHLMRLANHNLLSPSLNEVKTVFDVHKVYTKHRGEKCKPHIFIYKNSYNDKIYHLYLIK